MTTIPTFPEPTSTIRPTGALDPRADGCPDCGAHDNAPREVEWTPGGSAYYATYVCAFCRHSWWTGWATEQAVDAL